jgi:hypothetical protein
MHMLYSKLLTITDFDMFGLSTLNLILFQELILTITELTLTNQYMSFHFLPQQRKSITLN